MNAFLVEDWVVVGGDEHVIHVDDEPTFAKFFFKNSVHHHLEGSRGVGHAEEHHHRFEESLVSNKCCLPLVSVSDSHVIIPPPYIEFSKEGSTPCLVN